MLTFSSQGFVLVIDKIKITVLLLIFLFGNSVAIAQDSLENAKVWIESQANSDDFISNDEVDISTSFQSTAEALTTLRLLGSGNALLLDTAESAIVNTSLFDTESLSRAITSTSGNIDPELISLLTARVELLRLSGGIGTFDFFEANSLETSWALLAFNQFDQTNLLVSNQISYLLGTQNENGSFGSGGTIESQLYSTYVVLNSLYAYRSIFDVEASINNAVQFVLNQRVSGGGWGNSYLTAIGLLAVLPFQTDVQQLQASIESLQGMQSINGSWDDDVYIVIP